MKRERKNEKEERSKEGVKKTRNKKKCKVKRLGDQLVDTRHCTTEPGVKNMPCWILEQSPRVVAKSE